MADLGSVTWPPEPIRTERLVLRELEARDRAAIIELNASSEVGAYIGGARARDELEREIPTVPKGRPGQFVVDLDGTMIGVITLDSHDGEHQAPRAAGKIELGYLFLPQVWGRGYAAESGAAALDWFAGALPGEPVVLTTQTANVRSVRLATRLGFVEAERFEAYGAEQWFGVWSPRVGDVSRPPR
jgi:RimJ/RimL family protein N-acetyltransferase